MGDKHTIGIGYGKMGQGFMDWAYSHRDDSQSNHSSPFVNDGSFYLLRQIGRQNFAAQSFPINLNITMQNTVTESNALALCANVFLNSTTKFVKGLAGTAHPNTILSALLPEKEQGGQSSIHLSSLILKSSPPRTKDTILQSPKGKEVTSKSGIKEEMSQVEAAAISLSGNIYMNSTTKYVKGYHSPSPQQQPQKKSRSQGKKKDTAPSPAKKVIDPQATPSSVKKQKTPQKTAMEITGSNYMTATTKYVKNNPQGSSLLDNKAKVEKIVRNNPGTIVRTNQKVERVVSRDKPRRERESIGPKTQFSPTKSKSSSGSKIERKKDRTRELKFIERTKPEESMVTVKDRASSIDFQTKRNDTKIIQHERNANKPEPPQIVKENQYSIPQNNQSRIPAAAINSPQPNPPIQRTQRNTINQAKSADNKKAQPKQESTTKPFSRHPQHIRPQLLSRHNNEMIKSATSLPAADLPLQTPIKPKFQSSKIIPSSQNTQQDGNNNNTKPIARSQKVIPISVIKEQRSSAMQNTKTTITNNKKSTHYSQHQEEPSSTHKEDHNRNSEVSKIGRNQPNKIIKKDDPVSTIHQGYAGNTNYSPRSNKVQERKDEPPTSIAGNYNRPVQRRPQQPQPVKESHVQSRRTTTPSLLQEKIPPTRPQRPIEQKPIKTQPSDKGSKTSIQQTTIDVSKKKITTIAQNQASRVLQTVSPPAKLPQNTNTTKKSEPIIQRQQSPRQNVKEITESKQQIVKRPSSEQIPKQEPSLKRSYALIQAVHRLYTKTLSKALESIVKQGRSLKVHTKQASILAYQTINFFQSIQKSWKSSVFQQIKRALPSKLAIKKEINIATQKETAASIIFRVLLSKHRQNFKALKRNTSFHGPVPLENSSKSQGNYQQPNKAYVLFDFRKIAESFTKKWIQKAFNKIILQAISHQKEPITKQPPPQPIRSAQKYTKPPRNYQAQKTSLLQQKSSLQSTVSNLQTRISDKKRYLDSQKTKLSKKQSELIKKNKTTQTIVLQKRISNKEMKKKLESLGQQQDLDISLPQYEPLIGILTDIYTTVFASKEEKINTKVLVQKYQLNKEDHNPLLQEWSSLLLNARLKHEISQWQGSNAFGACEARLRAQGEVLSKMTRSFIRERYLWEWVKTTAQKA